MMREKRYNYDAVVHPPKKTNTKEDDSARCPSSRATILPLHSSEVRCLPDPICVPLNTAFGAAQCSGTGTVHGCVKQLPCPPSQRPHPHPNPNLLRSPPHFHAATSVPSLKPLSLACLGRPRKETGASVTHPRHPNPDIITTYNAALPA